MSEEEESSISTELQKLEEHVTFLDEHIAQQDKEIMNLRKKLDQSIAELKELREHFQSGSLSMGQHEEKPPHY